MGKVRVPVYNTSAKSVLVDPAATEGAVVGVNLRWPDGTLVTVQDLTPSAAPDPTDPAVTIWRWIREVPANVRALAAASGTGLFAITGTATGAFREIQPTAGRITVSNGSGVAGDPAIDLALVADSGEGALRGITRDAYGRVTGTTDATITGTPGEIDVANGDASAGAPTISLADVTPAAGGTLRKVEFDAKGRRSEEDDATTDDLSEGATNLYLTNARVDARIDLQKGQPGGLATLDGSGKLDGGQLPALAITETFVVADEAAMLALTAQQGDVAVRTDNDTSYILTAEPASTLANWQELLTPTAGAVTSFNGRTGAVVPQSGDYTPAQVGAEPAISTGTTAQYWRGDKTWRDFATDVRAAVLTGLSTATNAAITATDTVLQALGKLQAQLSGLIVQTITNGDTTHAPSSDAVFDAIRFSGALVGLSGTQSIATGVTTTLPWGSEEYDTDSYHDNALNPSRLTVPANGYYIVSASIRYAPDPNGSRRAQIFKNGASFPGRTIDVQVPAVGQNSILNITSPAILCTAGDYFEVETVQDSGVSLNVAANDATWFAIRRIATD